MKLCRFGENGNEKPGLIDEQGKLRSLEGICKDIDHTVLSPEGLKCLSQLDVHMLPYVPDGVRFGVPVASVSKCVCIGLNYKDHASEAGLPLPSEPIIFMKAPSALCGADDPIIMPRGASQLDWEVELGVVIGSEARYVSKENALSYAAGYCVFNDVSERCFQMQSTQWDKGKSCDSFGPVGPWLVTKDEVTDPQNRNLWLEVNQIRMQAGNTGDMVFSVASLIAYVSHYMTLMPGDIIATGTPAGVGMGQKPHPVWLNIGDTVRLGIEGLGSQKQKVISDTMRTM